MSLVRKWLSIVVASATGILVLLGSLWRTHLALAEIRNTLVDWAVIVAGFAFILGVLNVLRVHGGRVVHLKKGWVYSSVLLAAATAAAIATTLQGPSGNVTQAMFSTVITPVGASLAALVLFALVIAAFRMLRVRRDASSVLFAAVVVVALLGTTPLIGWSGLVHPSRDWAVNVFGMAGMRGLFLGVALGTVITALRALLLGDWPHIR